MTGQPMIAAKAPRAKARTRSRLMTGGAMGMAIGALMLAPQQARAQVTIPGGQAFQGTAQVAAGGATVVQTATQDTITLTTPQAVINWTPNDRTGTGTIDFLPEGLRGLFIGDADFTVLNRIIPVDGSDIPVARMIALNGIIDSQIRNAAGGAAQGGSVWFYSPGGILVGGTSVINVGSLLLTSRDIDTSDGLFGPSGEIRFRNPALAGANGTVQIDALARINARNATPGSAYIAVVAPRVVQAGTVRADGSIALVAAEQADIRINQGLFDINVTVGTSDSNGIVHTGTTGGPSDTSGSFESRAYLVAVPKNQAITMLLSGTVGYETASSVSIAANGGIVLSAGHNVHGGVATDHAAGASGNANISITDSRFANALDATATGTISARPDQSCQPICDSSTPNGQLLFGGNTRLSGANGVAVSIGQAQRIIVNGDLSLLSARPGQGGSASLTVDNALPASTSTAGGGIVQVAGALLIDASAGANGATGLATGGSASLSVNNGVLGAGAITVLASATAGIGGSGDGQNGTGGAASLVVTNSASVFASGGIRVGADGRGSGPGVDAAQNPTLVTNGGDGRGGSATVTIDVGGSLSSSQGLVVSADGTGAAGSATSGDGFGGTASISIDSGAFSSGFTHVSAFGSGGGSGFDPVTFTFLSTNDGGDGQGGTASFSISNTSASDVVASSVRVDAGARGGVASNSSNPPVVATGGNATGGNARFSMSGLFSSAQIADLVVSSSADGGSGVGELGVGGTGTGGSSTLNLLFVSTLDNQIQTVVTADGSGGVGGNASAAGTGGNVDANFASGATLNGDSLRLSANGLGGGTAGPFQSFSPNTNIGGSGSGGIVSISTAGNVNLSELQADAIGFGGDANPVSSTTPGLRGGDAAGGSVNFTQTGGDFIAVGLAVRTNATGGGSGSPAGSGGNGTGGTSNVLLLGGLLSANTASVEAFGASNLTGDGTSGNLRGGSVRVGVTNNAAFDVVETLTLNATADAGSNTFTFANSGNAIGGNIDVTAGDGGLIGASSLIVDATGRSAGSSEVTGSGTGGIIAIAAGAGGRIIARNSSTIGASGIGGNGITAGQGTGGSVDLTMDGGSIALRGTANINASGQSGFAFTPDSSPESQGGDLSIHLTDSAGSAFTFDELVLGIDGNFASRRFDARTGGGESISGGGNFTNAPGNGNADGGTIDILIEGGTFTGTTLLGSASGYASDGGTGTGGRLTFTMSGGDVNVSSLQLLLTGVGGTSPLDFDTSDEQSPSGDGIGGTATVSLTGGTLQSGFFTVDAQGVGGLGARGSYESFSGGEGGGVEIAYSGNGGDGFGGSIDVDIDGSVEVGTNFMQFTANGRGGNGGDFLIFSGDQAYLPGTAGSGTGGTVNVNLVGGTVNASSIFAIADGNGGDSGRVVNFQNAPFSLNSGSEEADPVGGDGIGGTATVRLTETVTSAQLVVNAAASGGEGGGALRGYAGGTGTGGLAEVIVDGASGGSIEIDLDASGRGGLGGRAQHGDGGDGGNGLGGTARFTVDNGGTFGLTTNSSLSAGGFGGSARSGQDGSLFSGFEQSATGFDGGDGGSGFGGTIAIVARNSDVEVALNSGEGFSIFNGGFGGSGGRGTDNNGGPSDQPTFGGNGGIGGDGRGGTTQLTAIGGTLGTLADGPLTIVVTGERGEGGLGGTGIVTSVTDPETGETTFFGGDGSNGFNGFTFGGEVRLEAQDSEATLGLVDLSSLSIDISGDFAGRVELIDDSSGAGITLGALDITSAGSPFLGSAFDLVGSGVYVRSRDTAISIGSSTDLFIEGLFQVDATGTGGLSVDGALDVTTTYDIVARHDGREGSATILADSIAFNGSVITFQPGTLVEANAGELSLTSASAITFDKLRATGGGIVLTAATDVFGSETESDQSLVVNAGAAFSIDTADIGGDVIARAGTGSARFGSLLTGGYAEITGVGVTLDSGDIGTRLQVRAQNGDALIGSVTTGAAADINSLLNISVGSLTTTGLGIDPGNPGQGAAILLNAGGTVTLGALDSAGLVFITADNLNQSSGSGESAGPGASSIVAAGSISIGTALDIDFGSASGQSISLFTTGGGISFGSTESVANTVMTATTGSITGVSVSTDDGDARLNAGGAIQLDNADVGDVLSLTAGVAGITLGTSVSGYDTLITTDGNVSIISATTTDIGTTAPTSSANIVIDAGGNVDAASLTSAENITITATALTNAASNIVAAGDVNMQVDAAALFGTLSAQSLFVRAGTGISFTSANANFGANLIAGTGVTGGSLTSPNGGVSVTSNGGNISIGSIEARFDAAVSNSDGGVTLGSVTTDFGGVFVDATDGVEIQLADSGGQFEIDSDTDIVIGTATVFGDAILDAGTTIIVNSLTTIGQTSNQSSAPTNSAIRLRAGGDVLLGTLDAVGDVEIDAALLAAAPAELGIPTRGVIVAGDNVRIAISGDAQFGSIDAGGSVDTTVGNIVSSSQSNVTAGGDIFIQSFNDIDLATISGASVVLRADDSIDVSAVTATGNASLSARTDIDGGSIDTGDFLSVNSAEGNIDLGSVNAHDGASFFALGNVGIGSLTSVAGDVTINAGDSVGIATGTIANTIVSTSGNDTAIGTLTTGGTASIDAGGDISVVSLTTTGLGGSQNSSAPSGANALLTAGGNVALGSVDSAQQIRIDATTLSGAESNLTAADLISIDTSGNATFGTLAGQGGANIDVGGQLQFASSTTQGSTTIRSAGPISGGDLRAESGSLSVTTLGGSNVNLQSAHGGDGASFDTGGILAVAGALSTSSGNALVDANGSVTLGSALIGGSLSISSGADVGIGGQSTATTVAIDADSVISLASFTATGSPATSSSPVSGGDIRLNSGGALNVSGDLDARNSIIIDAGRVNAAGRSMLAGDTIDISTGDDADLGTLDAGFVSVNAGNDIDFEQIFTGGGVNLTAQFDIDGGSIDTGGNAALSSAEGGIAVGSTDASGNITFSALQGQVSGNFATSRFGSTRIDAATVDFGDLYSGGSIAVFATGDVAIDLAITGGEGGQFDEKSAPQTALAGFGINECSGDCIGFGQDIIVDTDGTMTLGEMVSAEDILLSGAALLAAGGSMEAEGLIDIDVTGAASFGSLTASGASITVDAGDTIDGTIVTTRNADSVARITGQNGVTIATIRATDALEVRAANGAITLADVRAGEALVVGRSADVTATAPTLFTLAQATAGDLTVQGRSGTLTLADARASGALVVGSSDGALVIGTAQANSIGLQSDTVATLNGPVTATSGLTARIRNGITVNGVTSGASVDISSGDIMIGASGRIGTAGTTTSLTLANGNNNRQTFIGGGDTTAGYSLSATELSRLFAGSITLRGSNSNNAGTLAASAPGTAQIAPSSLPNVVIDTFTLTGGGAATGNIGASGSLTIESPGYVRVIGTATLNNLTGENRFVIDTDTAIQVIMGQGAIRLSGANGLGGTLTLRADDVVAATSEAITAIAGMNDSALIDERLAQNDGIISEAGALSANTIRFEAGSGVYVQNSGQGDAFDDRRGFTAGTGGVIISTGSSQSTSGGARIVINGVIDNGEGAELLTGVDAFERVTINGTALTGQNQIVSGIDAGSTLNGCLIVSASNCFAFEIDVIPPVQDNPLVDEEDEESEQSEGEDSLSVTTVIEIKDVEPLPNEPLIDDPVTGSPNDDLWTPSEGS